MGRWFLIYFVQNCSEDNRMGYLLRKIFNFKYQHNSDFDRNHTEIISISNEWMVCIIEKLIIISTRNVASILFVFVCCRMGSDACARYCLLITSTNENNFMIFFVLRNVLYLQNNEISVEIFPSSSFTCTKIVFKLFSSNEW